ncbi:MAG: GatB/YqeY domain-containing protein [Gemmatimonadetes bacterium]|nr:GatB/YqeY domain-containing protein [Gemmatimonadota bacterium]
MSDHLKDRLRSDLIDARKSRDKLRTVLLSTVLSDVHNREIDTGSDLDSEGVREVVSRAIKQRRDAEEQMEAGGRSDLAEKEAAEAEILQVYLPPPMSEEDVRALVRQAVKDGADEMGPLMGRIMPQIRGRFDGKEANRIVREELGG